MKTWVRRLRGAVGLGLTWAAAGFVAGVFIELVHNLWPNPIGGAVDIWPATLAVPGFLGGIAFSIMLGIVGRRRRLDELSLRGVAAMGAAGGLLVSLIPAGMVVLGLAAPNIPLWQITLGIAGPFSVGGGVAAAASLALARMAEDNELLAESRDVADVGLTMAEQSELLGSGG